MPVGRIGVLAMARDSSLNALTTCVNLWSPNPSLQMPLGQPNSKHVAFKIYSHIQRRELQPKPKRKSKFKALAGWFSGSKASDQKPDPVRERSDSANEDILMLFIQLDMATQVQRALNMEQYDAAQELRNNLAKIDEQIAKKQESRRGSSSSKSEAQDTSLTIARLRSDLKKAIEEEQYAVASKLRDQITKLEAESLSVIAKTLAYQNTEYAFRLGQKVKHKVFGYQAMICGMDPVCCETKTWMETAKVETLQRGANQPFYQVLVDANVYPDLPVAYVSEENLEAFEPPDLEPFDHPYASFLFYGMDGAGDYIPIKQLREKFSRPRHELPADEDGV